MASSPRNKALGIDYSQYQPQPGPYNKSTRFVIIRISSGDGGLHEDSKAAEHIRSARRDGKPMAFYHFLGNRPGVAEARFAITTMRKYGVWGYKLFCDLEGTATEADAKDFIREARTLMKPSMWIYRRRRRVGIYAGKYHVRGTAGAQFGWLANYDGFDRPFGWSRLFTKLWQYTSFQGGVHLDRDAFMLSPKRVERFFQPINSKGKRV